MKSFSYWTNQLHKAIDWCNGLGHIQAGLNITFQVLLYGCNQYGINLEAEYERKLAYNKTRGYRHGGKLL